MRPFSQAEGHNEPGAVDELVPSTAAMVEDVLVGGEDPVRKPVLAHVLPDVLGPDSLHAEKTPTSHPIRDLVLDESSWFCFRVSTVFASALDRNARDCVMMSSNGRLRSASNKPGR